MRPRPAICDACSRIRKRPNPAGTTSLDRVLPFCEAFPGGVPDQIYFGGFDHRQGYPGDGGVLFELREGGEPALAAYEQDTGERGVLRS
ncbi:hypothetical protein E1295_06000 [Nonomuraea mesophila]|uniref:Uncharacterized protein n=1 Tax=Nonomuraea mesophila TaxID=2530382 RepID=A0A4R5FVE7_9ACTN|nr:hypothetical protein [Nonomuraea mesophila]TDE58162.1 hypothetical protein E1295_06000 [Nonomuraea mesophila]